MDSERWKQVDSILQAVLEQPPSERAAFLREAAAGDEALEREVRSRLASHEQAGTFLERPAMVLATLLPQATGNTTETIAGRVAQLGPYRIDRPIGAGGMGEVLLATDTRLHRTVAIKILPRDKVADPERKRRFILEARAASALNHPNIITLHDIANDGGVDYLVMEYAPGQPLSERIAAQGLPLSEAIEYAIQIANALSAAHEAGIVHRDIKPGNVVVTPQGQVKILDFGLAKLSERQSNSQNETRTEELPLTETGVVMGTIAYMSPEQARGDAVDARSDLFSFGAMLYEMVTGRRAFLQRLDWTTPPADYVPAGLRPIVVKLLKVDRDLRYQTAADAAADLKRLKASEATPSLKRWSVSATVMLLPSTNGLLILEVLSSTKMSTSDFSAGRKITVSY